MNDIIYYPLTSPQLSIWYTDRMYPNTSISNVAGTLRIKEAVDIDLSDKAINLFIKNNDGMRLRICMDDEGRPRQYVSEYEYKKIEFKDFSSFDDPIKAMQEWDIKETLKPFVLLDSDLYRFIIIKINDNNSGFFFNFHHIITDAWSLSIIKNRIVSDYMNLKKGTYEEDINQIVPSYISYIENEQIYKNTNRYQKDKMFWEQQFAKPPEATVLKTRNSNQTSIKSKRKTFIAPKKFTNKLKTYCEENKITPYPLFLSALAMYINRTTEKENIIIGTPLLNRLNQTEKSTFGMFISTIPLCINIKSEDSFSYFSQSILEICMAAYRHQRFPYEHILKNVREKHGLSDNLYDVVLSYQNTKVNKESESECISRWHFNEYQSNSLTIHINDRDNEGVLILDYDYHSDLYYDKEIEFIHQHILSLLWHALDNPDNLVCKIEMLTESEKKKILYDFNNTYSDYPREKTIHQLFEEQVERTPDNIALIFEDKQVTYKVLNQKANSLASVLRNKGVKPDEIVGVMVNRSVEMIVGLLAILKAGGAYLPIEPEYPKERLNFVLQDSGINTVLIDDNNMNKITGCNSINISNEINYEYNTENPVNINTSRNLAYVIYTSGSTGQPKGVMIEHVSVINFVESVSKLMNFSSDSVVLSSTTYCFDIFVFEVITSLVKGARIALANELEQRAPYLIRKLISKQNVSILLTTPSKMRLLLPKDDDLPTLNCIKEIMLGGEPFPLDLLIELKNSLKARIINGYGPTETTIGVSFKELVNEKRISVGCPIDNIKIYILDKYLNILPIGIPGELYIGGEGLARGYLNRQELTAKSFIKDPFNANGKLYKTGDVAKWLSNGEIDILGRTDSQVKVNGYRIELEDIKKNILKMPGIQDAVVINQTVMKNKQVLCAYLKTEGQESPTSVRRDLSRILPDYMIPSYISFIPEIPLNSNGKVDMNKLPDPLLVKMEATYVAPQNNTETEVQNIWEKVLNIDDISVNNAIFELGADSLDLISISTAIYKKYSIIIPATDIREINTISKMSHYINNESLSMSSKNSNLCLLKKGRKNLFFIHAGSGEISNYINLSQNIDEEFACWGIRMDSNKYSPDNITLNDLAHKYVNYITNIQPKGPYHLAGWCIGGTIAFEMAIILEKRNETVNFLGLFNSIAPQHWDNIELFTPEGEIRFIEKELGFNSLKIEHRKDFSIEDVWESVTKKVNVYSVNDLEEMKRRIPKDMRLAIPRFDEANIVEIICYVNRMRTLHMARATYYPERKIRAKVYFYNALEDTIIKNKESNIESWNKYCRLKAIQYDIEANHYSLFQSPCVEKLGDLINNEIKIERGYKKSI